MVNVLEGDDGTDLIRIARSTFLDYFYPNAPLGFYNPPIALSR